MSILNYPWGLSSAVCPQVPYLEFLLSFPQSLVIPFPPSPSSLFIQQSEDPYTYFTLPRSFLESLEQNRIYSILDYSPPVPFMEGKKEIKFI